MNNKEKFTKKYGQIDIDSLNRMLNRYESSEIHRAQDLAEEAYGQIHSINQTLFTLHGPVFELFSGGQNGGHYDVKEHGTVWEMAFDICDNVRMAIARLQEIAKIIEPLQDLTPEDI